MAKSEYAILRGTFTMGVGKQAKDYGPGDTIALEEADAAGLVSAGKIIAVADQARARPKSDAARLKQLEADLATALAKGGIDPATLKAAEDGKAAAEADLAKAQQEVSALTIRVTEAEQLATEAATEAESLERVIAVIEAAQPELVAQAKETVAAEYQAAAETASQSKD